MGVLLFLIFIIGAYMVAEKVTKGMRENERELDYLRNADEKHNGKLIGMKGYEFFKKKK